MIVRSVRGGDFASWLPLWVGCNALYGREGATARPEHITRSTWDRFFNPIEPVFALVAEDQGHLVGLAHYLFHRSTTRVEPVCYLQDLFTSTEVRGKGVGRSLIQAVYAEATRAGASRVYWQTQATNEPGRRLYDKVAQHRGFIVYAQELDPSAAKSVVQTGAPTAWQRYGTWPARRSLSIMLRAGRAPCRRRPVNAALASQRDAALARDALR
ncbi:MAG: GNAT family N-acetyltransferase [Burkholderiales bacterium]|nr:GNAT family N-acetyltransferase [Burkholderiales bacterium]